MLFDICFFGLPILLAIFLGAHAIRETDNRYWRPTFCILAYCVFYLAGGREVLLYLTVGSMIGGGWICGGGLGEAL